MGNITIQGDLTGDVPGGEVGGASNLTTVGAIPYVSASGVLNQDPTALFWDAANDRLGVGTNAPASNTVLNGSGNPLSIGSVISTYVGLARGNVAIGTSNYFIASDGAGVLVNAPSTDIGFNTANANRATIKAITGNLLIGTTTDSNFKLDVAASGSAGTARFYGGSGVSDTTKVVVRSGGGQSTNLQEWQNSAGVVLTSVSSSGQLNAASIVGTYDGALIRFGGGGGFSRISSGVDGNLLIQNNAGTSFTSLQFGGTTSSFPALKRSSASLEVKLADDSAFTELALLRSRHNGVTVAALPAAAAGNAGSIQYVTDANATTIGSTVAGGGANKVMVWSDGAVWKIFAS